MLVFNVDLVSVSQPRIPNVNTAEEFLAYVARVSNPTNQINNETAPKLIKYLMKNHHWSPLEMIHVVLEIETTRDIARQMLRHRSFSFQEFSQRYADPTQSLGFVSREPRYQDKKNRQNSIILNDTEEDKKLREIWFKKTRQVLDAVEEAYAWSIENGIAKEQARAFLPEGLTMSRLYMGGTLRSWYHYCDLRSAHGTQSEHMDIAQAAWEVISKEFPSTAQALNEIRAEENVTNTLILPKSNLVVASKKKKLFDFLPWRN